MPSAVTKDDVGRSLLAFVADGKYPDSEDVVSTDFAPHFLPKGLQDISQARALEEINALSQGTASDVDGWISQARQLRADIERSRETARDIVAQHERTQPLQDKVKDASAKVQLITNELAFNEAVTDVLGEVQKFSSHIFNSHKAVEEEDIDNSITSLEAAERLLESHNLMRYTSISSILRERVSSLRTSIVDLLLSCWARQVRLSKNEFEVIINDESKQPTLSTLVTSLSRLGILDSVKSSFQHGVLENIIQPVLMPRTPGKSREISVGDHGIRVGEPLPSSIPEVLTRLVSILRYLREKLPGSVVESAAEAIIPQISVIFSESWLTPTIPLNLDSIRDFEDTLVRVNEFSKTIETFGWHGQEQLVSWVNHFPRLWLTRRRVDSLDQVRGILVQSQGSTKEVERVEKEVVTNKDDVLLETGITEDWDANWGNESEEEESTKTSAPQESKGDDFDAWGLEEELDDAEKAADEDENDDDAWGWGEEADEECTPDKPEAFSEVKSQGKDLPAEKGLAAREITLTERYTITDIPDSVTALLAQQISDSESLSKPDLYLAEKVRSLVEEHQLTRLAADIEGLERFGKLSYSKEMQTQRIIITDLLDGSQGFARCSEQPFLRECENAVDATVDRIRSVFKEWQPILSHSALLQAMGSLMSSVINKVIVDIEDLSDISEAESQTLIALCNRLSTLEDIFIPKTDVGATSMAAVYVRSWLKFQYLINILESSLADIRFLWTEGELRLEFSAEEVIELITALFAESDHRRKTISEIRRTR
ncbi:hypothetical protein UA08_00177 [Talaromyces atroroseus]|uniref:ZW10 C-terminal helical domain-containing protein n=1 Tax=Talaromyces atroroseus TaxID=1441469 RepID=A0A225B4G5_TALAT|nr:hypothetical protein UA08_00177 [Talaromyces atroroseus]OKL64638.1 hypothetical protein UA08_00177 [Talaromyces atroroseus]